ncbi:hypothetical protein CJ255_02265 [Candidatus Viridilinea mediisalina]|uniref:Uncharacterized protein n=1 Tax=Candidatus Viridilinea mediisalina TaxID=2024553 RepID=A0A2A6RPE2_9CHLR|nr:hypothetical protein CJ255_02265 [Candidatus Viridilinea mediisalina]
MLVLHWIKLIKPSNGFASGLKVRAFILAFIVNHPDMILWQSMELEHMLFSVQDAVFPNDSNKPKLSVENTVFELHFVHENLSLMVLKNCYNITFP